MQRRQKLQQGELGDYGPELGWGWEKMAENSKKSE